MFKIFWYLLALVVISALLTGVYFSMDYFFNQQVVTVGLKWKHQAQFAGMYVAKDLGYYRRSGLDVNFKELSFDSNSIDDLISGKLDFLLISPEEFILHINDGKDIKAVASFYQVSPYVIVSLTKSDIKDPGDFIGKTLGVKGGKLEEEIIYLLLLKKFGISTDDVEIKKIGFNKTELNDLLDGDVDTIGLYRTDQLYFFDKNFIDYNIIYPENFGINVTNDLLVTRGNLVEQDPKLVRNFVQNSIKGWKYAIDNIDQAVKITLDYIRDENYQDQEYQKYILTNSIPLIKTGTSQPIGLISSSNLNNLYKDIKLNYSIESDLDISYFYSNNFVR